MITIPDVRDPLALTAERLIEAALDGTGLDDFGSESYREGLELLCGSLRQERVLPGGRQQLAGEAVRHLANRLRVVEQHRVRPELADEAVEAPIVILGLPRTGTTAISYLLDRDPRIRCLLNWEAPQSVPPPTDESRRTDPRCTELLEFQRAVVDTLDPPPPHWEWADGPTECTFVLAQDFKTVMWESRVPSPAYREFISTCDMTSAYEYHRSVLQVLGSRTTGRWCLKMPAHGLWIDSLFDVYPDARIIWTHRDPIAATESFLGLIGFSHGLTLGAPDRTWIAETYPPRLVEQVRRPAERLVGRDDQVFHLHFDDLMADELATMERLYGWLDLELDGQVRRSMTDWLTSDHLGVARVARPSLEEFGLDRAVVRASFRPYVTTFDVRSPA